MAETLLVLSNAVENTRRGRTGGLLKSYTQRNGLLTDLATAQCGHNFQARLRQRRQQALRFACEYFHELMSCQGESLEKVRTGEGTHVRFARIFRSDRAPGPPLSVANVVRWVLTCQHIQYVSDMSEGHSP